MLPELPFFVALESRVWQALADGDVEADMELLDSCFVGVYDSGFASREDHAGQLSGGPCVGEFSICEPRLLQLAPDTALLSYRATFTRLAGAAAQPSQTVYVSSVWRRRGENWVNVFSQDTSASMTAGGAA